MVGVLVVRHAEALADGEAPAARWPLTGCGRERASALARTLAARSGITEVWSSPECKARETAALAVPQMTAVVRNELAEVGRPRYPNAEEHRAATCEHLSGRDAAGWGPRAEVLHRLQRTERALPLTGCVVVVSHGVLLTTWLAHAAGLEEAARLWREILLPEARAVDLADRAAARVLTT